MELLPKENACYSLVTCQPEKMNSLVTSKIRTAPTAQPPLFQKVTSKIKPLSYFSKSNVVTSQSKNT